MPACSDATTAVGERVELRALERPDRAAAGGCARGTAPRRRRCCRRRRSCVWSSRNALTGARRPRGERAQVGAVEAGVERLEAEPRVEERVVLRRARAAARPSRSGAGRRSDSSWSPRSKTHARVRRVRLGVEQQRPGHAQVHGQEDVVGELGDQVLAAPAEPLDAPPLGRASASSRGASGRDQRSSTDLEPLQRPALDVRREAAADRLDLGELGHVSRGYVGVRRGRCRARAAGRGRSARGRRAAAQARAAVGAVELEQLVAPVGVGDVVRGGRSGRVRGALVVAGQPRDRVRRAEAGQRRDGAAARRTPSRRSSPETYSATPSTSHAGTRPEVVGASAAWVSSWVITCVWSRRPARRTGVWLMISRWERDRGRRAARGRATLDLRVGQRGQALEAGDALGERRACSPSRATTTR